MEKVDFNKYLLSKPAIFIYYFLITCFWTWPIIININSKVLGYHDAWQFMWDFWWVKTALVNLHVSPFYTNYIHWPNGISLLFQTLSLTNSLIALPLQYFLNLTTTYNVLALFNFTLAGFGTYLLISYLTKNKFAGFLGGYIVAFSPYMFARSLGHLNLLAFGWVSLFIYFYIKMTNGDGKWYWPSLFLIIIAFTDLYYFFYCLLFLCLHWIFLAIFNRNVYKKYWKAIVLMFLSALILLSPYLGTLVYAKQTDSDFTFIGHNPLLYSQDLMSTFIPGITSHFKSSTKDFWRLWSWESQGYLGYSVLIMSLLAAALIRKRKILFWWFVLFVFYFLSLGPYLQINGLVHKNIPLLYYLALKYIPFMNLQGVPSRFISFSFLSAAILSGYFISLILKSNYWFKNLLITFFVIALLIEYWPAKPVISILPVADFYSVISKDGQDYTLLDTSFEPSRILYYQTIHQKHLIGGYTSRTTVKTQDFLNKTPVISNIYNNVDLDDNFNRDQAIEILKSYNIKYVLTNVTDTDRTAIIRKLDLAKTYENNRIIVFQVY